MRSCSVISLNDLPPALRVLVEEEQLENHIGEDIVLLKKDGHVFQRLTALFRGADHGLRRLPSQKGTIWLEMAPPSDLPPGFDGLCFAKTITHQRCE